MWMKKLAQHFEKMRSIYPSDRLIVLFDIDGTILDMRHMVLSVLHSYDQTHSSSHFNDLKISDIDVHENHVESLLSRMKIPAGKAKSILEWVTANLWTPENLLEAHLPFSGVMEVMRWLQIQADTYVGLNTGRPEYMRAETLNSLNHLGKEYKVRFTDELLHMSSNEWEASMEQPKVEGVRYYRDLGYRVVAFIDNEPDNLLAVSEAEGTNITTIEGLDPAGKHPVQQAWIEHQVPQCGYCQSGMIMQAAAFLAENPDPTDDEIVDNMTGNICRCATYFRIVDAVRRAAEIKAAGKTGVGEVSHG